jgi:hypothetical protein
MWRNSDRQGLKARWFAQGKGLKQVDHLSEILVDFRRFGGSGVRHAESQQEAALFGARPHARA